MHDICCPAAGEWMLAGLRDVMEGAELVRIALLAALGCTVVLAGCSDAPQPDVPYIPTPQPVVDTMLELGGLKEGDVLYDLGSGDGRIPITAAKEYGVRAVGIEIDPALISVSNANARAAGVEDLVEFQQGDLFSIDVSEASVVTLYLTEELNLRLRPKLLEELKPGARVVSHSYSMGDWVPDEQREVGDIRLSKWIVGAGDKTTSGSAPE